MPVTSKDRKNEIMGFIIQKHIFNNHSRSDYPNHFTVDQSFGQRWIFGLITYCNFIALINQPGNIALNRAMGNSTHRNGKLIVFISRGQSDF